jgi:hypothetical protein
MNYEQAYKNIQKSLKNALTKIKVQDMLLREQAVRTAELTRAHDRYMNSYKSCVKAFNERGRLLHTARRASPKK